MAVSFAKIILARLSEELKPRGFKKNAQTFIRSVNDCVQIVNLQTSSNIVNERRDFSINLGVYSTRLEPLEKDATRLKVWETHWDAHLGDFLARAGDGLWRVFDEQQAHAASEAMVVTMLPALEAMDRISSYEAILRIPRGPGTTSDDPPGASNKWHIIEAARVREGLPPREAPDSVEGWRSSWHRRHFPDYDTPEPEPNPLMDALKRSRELGKSVPGVTLVTADGVAPMADEDE